MKTLQFLIYLFLLAAPAALIAQNQHTAGMDHGHDNGSGLTEAGNDAFGTIQEVILFLENDPHTDWKKVNIEALRQHLTDMQDMTINIQTRETKNVPGGFRTTVTPTIPRALAALDRTLAAHPAQLEKETGWKMSVNKKDGKFIIQVTSDKPSDVDKIRGLGYVGIMAYGRHHQPHHLAIASGENPHTGH